MTPEERAKEDRHAAVKRVIREQVFVAAAKDISDETEPVRDLCFDSLDCVEVIMTLEELFDIEIADEQAEKWVTVKDILDYVDGRMEQK